MTLNAGSPDNHPQATAAGSEWLAYWRKRMKEYWWLGTISMEGRGPQEQG